MGEKNFPLTQTANYQYYRLTFTETTGTAIPTDLNDLAVWFDASDLDADGLTDTSNSTTNITNWMDKSGNDYHALSANGTPRWVPSGGPQSKQVVEIRGGDYLPLLEISSPRIIFMYSVPLLIMRYGVDTVESWPQPCFRA